VLIKNAAKINSKCTFPINKDKIFVFFSISVNNFIEKTKKPTLQYYRIGLLLEILPTN